ncbi:MAG: pentapeptide repeat-containing protein, partial [Betaproteobacteria bacterium]
NDTIASLAVSAWINGGRVIWQEADLLGADLSWVNLSGCDLFGADLRDGDLTGADLRGANLREADLSGAKIELGNRTFTLNEETSR